MTNRVRDNPTRRRYELDVDGAVAFIDYRRHGQVVTMTHAEVPIELRGGGIGSALARGALTLAREGGDRVIPACSFVEAYVRRHPEFRDLLA
jgi:predicted GNAT family acetyltransferase